MPHTPEHKISLLRCGKERIVKEIEKNGCKMLKGKLDGTETKDELVEYLLLCKCPVLKSKFKDFYLPKVDGSRD